ELLALRWIEVEEAQREAFRVHDELAPRPECHFGAQHARLHEHRLPGRRRGERREHRLVLVAHRQMQHQLCPAVDAELRELLCGPGSELALQPAYRIASISTSAPRGRLATPTAARDGYGCGTYCAMISFTLAKCERSVRYTVIRTQRSSPEPAARAIASRLRNTRCVCASNPSTSCMLAGSRPIWPET